MTDKRNDRRGLGRGLSALMADVAIVTEDAPTVQQTGDGVLTLPIEKIAPNPDQPRRRFAQDNLDELAASIREKGVLQPLILRPDPEKEGHYQIVAGERRWRASQMARLHELPAIVRDFDDTEVLEVAIIENIQRADLNAIEEAAGYRQLMDKFGHTQEQMAQALGKSRSHIANILRLLNLPDDVRELVSEGRLSSGHARALITSEHPGALAREVVAKGLSVRQTEQLVKRGDAPSRSAPRPKPRKDADTVALEQDLESNIKMPVSIDHDEAAGSGKFVISYRSLEELDNLCRILTGASEDR
ncbi:ParB/RepB/Spo0J family partition protein [Profundibacterium mesophilum]|uniref:Tryptophanyl-tRNA synthetase n=1 Tax=Profundibacterium mesophilum KAUST100406-0324 TaxID=1037889 RepID=A0A921NRK3_9RHOB|nr:ParB/RepB/Spo0J family partition protein [Profundibacterium mesophilum]KAF0676322.1 tryptophanyl-tRNA synthetase [Profundibacterium mesophilum KAUST100406-0324]